VAKKCRDASADVLALCYDLSVMENNGKAIAETIAHFKSEIMKT